MAAGLGFKTFTTGEVLTAADVNGYLMQGILVFATEAARNAAITSPQEGQFAFTKDNNSLWYYTGSAWVASGATGDIEGVTAGVGITGGGTSGTVTITNDMATTITASGDIVVGTGNGTYDNLPIGTTGQVLTADTTVSPYKVKWASGSSGLTLISRVTFSNVASQILDNVFTATYPSYLIRIEDIYAGTSSDDLHFQLRFAGPTTRTASYYGVSFGYDLGTSGTVATGSANTAQFTLMNDSGTSATVVNGVSLFYRQGTGLRPTWTGTGINNSTGPQALVISGTNSDTTSYTGFLIKSGSSNITGTISVYGLGA